MTIARALSVLIGVPLALALTALAVDAASSTAPQSQKPTATTRPASQQRSGTTRPVQRDAANSKSGNRFGLPEPKPRTPGAIRIATYNTLNLFDHVDDPTLQGEFDDIKTPTSKERCAKLAEVIKTIDADIIALQEVESIGALKWFRDTFLPDAGYAYLESMDVGYFRGVECSVMSRFPIVNAKIWPNESLDNVKREGPGWAAIPQDVTHLTYQRSPLMVEIDAPNGYKITLFSEHHKAGGNDQKHHREAEALRNMEIITALQKDDPARNIVILGDFNAAPWDKSLRTYLNGGMIDTLAYRTTGKDDEESPLYKTHESDRVLDYILLNSAACREYLPDSGFVYGTLYPPPSYDWKTDPPPPGYASDHYPVVIDLIPKDQS